MPNATLEEVQPGWKVFAGADEVGKVAEAREHELDVRRGTIFQHTYRVPEVYVRDADDGIVDLSIDRGTFEDLEVRG
jgi:hypothetical protein